MEPGRCSNLSAATKVCWYCVCVRQIYSANSLSLSQLSPLFPLVSWVIILWLSSLLMSCPIVFSSSNWSSVSVIPPTPKTITFNASSNKCVQVYCLLGSSPAKMQAVFSVLDKHVCTYSSSIQNIFPCNYNDFIFFSASVEYSILIGNTVPL